jgi:NAD(P)H-flavin reductase
MLGRNCPKYINVRHLKPFTAARPEVVYDVPAMDPASRLPDEIIEFILASDTVFIATVYKAAPEYAERFPSHAGMNHRGGRKGFMRVRNDGRTVILPDFSGDRMMTSLGNVEVTHLAGLTMFDFVSGAVLYITGDADNLIGPPSLELMPRQASLTTIAVTGYTFVRDALPFRQAPGSTVERSPYTPPIRLLAEEPAGLRAVETERAVLARLTRIDIHSDDLASFRFELPDDAEPIIMKPSQAIALDLMALLGPVQYSHMMDQAPTALNDDRVRTWTIAGAAVWAGVEYDSGDKAGGTRVFTLTIRRKPGGAVTGALFSIAHKLRENKPEMLADTRALGIEPRVVGVSGGYPSPAQAGTRRMLWIAGGIGLTPFMALLEGLAAEGARADADVVLALATREPAVLVPLVWASLGGAKPAGLKLQLDVFVTIAAAAPALKDMLAAGVVVNMHQGRIPGTYWANVTDGREVFICGPPDFGDLAVKSVREAGVPVGKVHNEDFEY